METTDRRSFLKQTSLLVAGAGASGILPLRREAARPLVSRVGLDAQLAAANSTEGLYIDHVIYAVREIEATKARLLREYGLIPSWMSTYSNGREIWRVLLDPPQYLELITVVDAKAAEAAGGIWPEVIRSGDRLAFWNVGTTDIEAVGRRLGRTPGGPSFYRNRDGTPVDSWRAISLSTEDRIRNQSPAILQWEGGDARLARMREQYRRDASPARPGKISWIEANYDEALLRDWLGNAALPIRLLKEPPGVYAVAIESARGEIVIR